MENSSTYHPLKLCFLDSNPRKLYFKTERDQQKCIKWLHSIQGFRSKQDQYKIIRKIGEGATSMVMLA